MAWMIRFSGFSVGVLLAASLTYAPAAEAQWSFGVPKPLSEIEQNVADHHDDIEHVSPDELIDMQANGQNFILLDVREQREFEVSHIPGAIQIDPDARATDVRALLAANGADADTPVVVYCSVGRRSSRLGSRVVDELDGRKVINLRGGVFAWHNGEQALEDAGGQTDLVHPYNNKWGKLIERKDGIAYEPAAE